MKESTIWIVMIAMIVAIIGIVATLVIQVNDTSNVSTEEVEIPSVPVHEYIYTDGMKIQKPMPAPVPTLMSLPDIVPFECIYESHEYGPRILGETYRLYYNFTFGVKNIGKDCNQSFDVAILITYDTLPSKLILKRINGIEAGEIKKMNVSIHTGYWSYLSFAYVMPDAHEEIIEGNEENNYGRGMTGNMYSGITLNSTNFLV